MDSEHLIPIEILLKNLGLTSLTYGLTHQQVADRLIGQGYNLLPLIKPKTYTILIMHRSFILYCVLFTTLITEMTNLGPSYTLSHIFIVAFTVVLLVIKIFTKSIPTLPSIDSMVPVVRHGNSNIVESKFLVRGDVIQIQDSMTVPADIRLVSVTKLVINGTSLFGKEGVYIGDAKGTGNYCGSKNMAFQGSVVESGKGVGVVLKTGNDTFLAKISKFEDASNKNETIWLLIILIL